MRWAVALAERSLNGYVEADLRIRRGDGTIVEVELTSSIYLNEDGVERSLVLLNEKPGAVESLTPFAYDLVGHVKLTQAELRILRLLPTHHSIGDISESLCVGQNTAKTHLASIYRKLGVHNRALGRRPSTCPRDSAGPPWVTRPRPGRGLLRQARTSQARSDMTQYEHFRGTQAAAVVVDRSGGSSGSRGRCRRGAHRRGN